MPISRAMPATVSGSPSTAPSTCHHAAVSPAGTGQFLGEREELAVQLERRDGGRGQQVLLAACHAGPPAGTAMSS